MVQSRFDMISGTFDLRVSGPSAEPVIIADTERPVRNERDCLSLCLLPTQGVAGTGVLERERVFGWGE